MRVGAVDLGTNSTRLLIADVEDGRITEVVRRLAITRLGEGVDVSHELLPGRDRARPWVTRLLDGEAEAETTFRGVTSDRSLAAGTLLVDIGGGSTELLVGGPEGVSFAMSLQAGCVRLTERFLAGDPPTAAELEAAAAHARSLLPALAVESAIGVAGTVTTVAAIDLGLEAYDPSGSTVTGSLAPPSIACSPTPRLSVGNSGSGSR